MMNFIFGLMVGPHPISMGSAYNAYAERVDGIFFNPSAASMASRVMIGGFYSQVGYYGGGIVIPNRFISIGLAGSIDTTRNGMIYGVLARNFSGFNIGLGIQYPYTSDTSSNKNSKFHIYSGFSFYFSDYFMFGFTAENLDTPNALSLRFGIQLANYPLPVIGRNLAMTMDLNSTFARNVKSQDLASIGFELDPFYPLFLRFGYNYNPNDSIVKHKIPAGLGLIYVYNTVDILGDISVNDIKAESKNKIWTFGLTVKFFGHTVWAESSPKIIEVLPEAEASVTKICFRYILPSKVSRWTFNITNRWGKIYKTYWGDGPPPSECIYWHVVDEEGKYVGKGVYYYDFIVKTEDGKIYKRRGGLVNVKKGVKGI